MIDFTAARDATTADELWVVEHDPVFTLGQAGRPEHLRDTGGIPVVRSDRGGQVTYHGPGQLTLYLLLDLRRANLGVRQLVALLEQAVIKSLATLGIAADIRASAPGVYVRGAKIASLGLRVRHGCCYHGLALNVAMDLSPFARIDPCGYPGLPVTQLADLGCDLPLAAVADILIAQLRALLHPG
jgi:lipoyl(octanoyl) transferase